MENLSIFSVVNIDFRAEPQKASYFVEFSLGPLIQSTYWGDNYEVLVGWLGILSKKVIAMWIRNKLKIV